MRLVVVGGGVAGVCCAEELCRLRPGDEVALVSADRVLKGVSVVARLGRSLEELALVERALDELPWPNLTHVQELAAGVDLEAKALLLGSGRRLPFDKLCICAGARPKQLPPVVFRSASGAEAAQGEELAALQRRVLTIRDTDSVQRLGRQLRHAARVAVVGNGGIALELISGLKGADVTWVMKHAHIGDAYFDLDAAHFLLEELQRQRRAEAAGATAEAAKQTQQAQQQDQKQRQKQQQGEQQGAGAPPARAWDAQQAGAQAAPAAGSASGGGADGGAPAVLGHAVGPRWAQQLPAAAGAAQGAAALGAVDLEYGSEIAEVRFAPPQAACQGAPTPTPHNLPQQEHQEQQEEVAGTGWDCPLQLTLTNGRQVSADLVLLAIGVRPALEWAPPGLERTPDGGLRVNRHMQSSHPDVYAAGDSASCAWAADASRHWFQMRLWSQARAMGIYAAHCMAGVQEETGAEMAFELFTHVTRFLGKKVVLLGLYNGQRLEGEPAEDVVTYSRVMEHEDGERSFVRVLLLRGRMQGAVLIGDTDLEETCENLIMDQLDVGQYGPHLLDPEVELDHVFD